LSRHAERAEPKLDEMRGWSGGSAGSSAALSRQGNITIGNYRFWPSLCENPLIW
jgi:hypothetical protein